MSKSPVRTLLTILGLCLPLLACGPARLTPQQDADLRAAYEKMRVNDIAALEAAFEPKVRTPQLHQSLTFMQGMIPPQAPRVRLLKAAIDQDKGRTDYGGIYEYDYPSTAVLAQVEMRQDAGGRKTLLALQLRQADRNITDHFAFGLTGKKPYQYAFLFLTLLSPALGVWGLVMLWRAPDIRWKVLCRRHADRLHGPDHGLDHGQCGAEYRQRPYPVDFGLALRAAVAVDDHHLPAPGGDRLPARLPPAGPAVGSAEDAENLEHDGVRWNHLTAESCSRILGLERVRAAKPRTLSPNAV